VAESIVYKIGVEMVLMGGLAEGLTRVIGNLGRIEGKVDSIHGKFENWGSALTAVAGIMAVGVLASALDDVLKKTSKLSAELTRVMQLGASPQEMGALHNVVSKLTGSGGIPGATQAGITKTYGEIRSLFGPGEHGAAEARAVLPAMTQLQMTMGGFSGDYEKSGEDLRAMIKSADIMGWLTDPKTGEVDSDRLMKFLNVANQAYIGTHGQVNPQTWLGQAKQGGVSLRGLDETGLMQMAMFSQIMGGQRSGTAMMSLFQQLAGGTMFSRSANAMQQIGLLGPKGEIDPATGKVKGNADWATDHGRVVISEAASKRLSEFFEKNPMEGIKKLQETMVAAGITDPQAQMRELFQILGRATTQRFVGEGLTNYQQMIREGEQLGNAQDIPTALATGNDNSIPIAMHSLYSAITVLEESLGESHIQAIVEGIKKITGVINGLTDAVRSGNVDTSNLHKIWDALKEITGWISWANEWAGKFNHRNDGPPPPANPTTGGYLNRGSDFDSGSALPIDPNQRHHRMWYGPGIDLNQQTYSNGWPSAPKDFNQLSQPPSGQGPSIDLNQQIGPPSGRGPAIDYNQRTGPNGYSTGWPDATPQKQSFVAPSGGGSRPIVTTVALNIDGRQLASQLAEHLAELLEFPNQAPYGDDSSSYHGPAGSTTDT
jgi:hypothetical protein